MHLVDLLASLALSGLLLASTLSVFVQGQRAYAYGVARVESQQAARVALARIVRDLRQAGLGGGAFPPLAVAAPSQLVIQCDLDADGIIGARGETITWLVSGGVLRRNAGAGAQPIVDGVRKLAFTYLDAGGRSTTSLAAVRVVAVTITTEPEHAGASGGPGATFSTEVRLRNR